MNTIRLTVRFFVLVSLSMVVGSTPARCQTQTPTRGDIVIEKHLAHEAAKLSQRVWDGAKSRDEWNARRPRLKQELIAS
ncbi:MAG: hypothetical protein EXS16_22055 [Gemmataceae bacterium]|nr:hypothetical protein [Gemmataceae bacterium]